MVALKDNDLDGLFGGKDHYKIADDAASLDRAKASGLAQAGLKVVGARGR